MGEILGGIQSALGWALDRIYTAIPIYGVAIVLLTLAVRALLIPLTVKQIRSMTAMQKLQPEIKKIQSKYKQMQQKAKDRTEIQQMRLAMNKEMQELFRLHGASPYSGCLPLLAQMPVYIAMFSIMRAAIIVVPTAIALTVGTAAGGEIPSDLYTDDDIARETICRPTSEIDARRSSPTEIRCEAPGQEPRTFRVESFVEPKRNNEPRPDAGWI
ncbi:MAG TPA: YidC/Oxa1 family membrane protein insertase, partial [Actinomycetota bacterium]|nr:YidC/Oxa1 family membrane protein insertase [Actinomycetota bacterium]